jgi:RNA polymerase-binding transcription factor DksA
MGTLGGAGLLAEDRTVDNKVETIQKELAQMREQVTKLAASLEERPDYGLGEGDPSIVRWELNQVLLQQCRERVANLEEALARLNQGTYGTCEKCGNDIHPDRLAVLPDTRICIRCARENR